MLLIEDVVAGYGRVKALRGITLEVKEGEIVALIGPNGAGKTTTMKTIMGLVRPTEGRLVFRGAEMQGKPPDQVVKSGISLVPEGRKVFPYFTVKQNLEIGAISRQDQKAIGQDMERVLEVFPVLKERLNQRGGTLSGGEQQMLAVGRALMSRPKMLLLDEPSLGLAPIVVENLFRTLKEINEQGTTMLLVEQNAFLALNLSQRAYVMESGQIALSGNSSDLLKNEVVQKVYLGFSDSK